ncbi:hypothetical protein H4R35_001441 [Dimargaris xerosporica]|nr:hypothetical protein H4R35_001441 [Dimargaris xerosporica]
MYLSNQSWMCSARWFGALLATTVLLVGVSGKGYMVDLSIHKVNVSAESIQEIAIDGSNDVVQGITYAIPPTTTLQWLNNASLPYQTEALVVSSQLTTPAYDKITDLVQDRLPLFMVATEAEWSVWTQVLAGPGHGAPPAGLLVSQADFTKEHTLPVLADPYAPVVPLQAAFDQWLTRHAAPLDVRYTDSTASTMANVRLYRMQLAMRDSPNGTIYSHSDEQAPSGLASGWTVAIGVLFASIFVSLAGARCLMLMRRSQMARHPLHSGYDRSNQYGLGSMQPFYINEHGGLEFNECHGYVLDKRMLDLFPVVTLTEENLDKVCDFDFTKLRAVDPPALAESLASPRNDAPHGIDKSGDGEDQRSEYLTPSLPKPVGELSDISLSNSSDSGDGDKVKTIVRVADGGENVHVAPMTPRGVAGAQPSGEGNGYWTGQRWFPPAPCTRESLKLPPLAHTRSAGSALESVAFNDGSESLQGRLTIPSPPLASPSVCTEAHGIDAEDDAGSVGLSCTICLEDYIAQQQVRVLPCHHVYHTGCIDTWLTTKHSHCPLCKFDCYFYLRENYPQLCTQSRAFSLFRRATTPLYQGGSSSSHHHTTPPPSNAASAGATNYWRQVQANHAVMATVPSWQQCPYPSMAHSHNHPPAPLRSMPTAGSHTSWSGHVVTTSSGQGEGYELETPQATPSALTEVHPARMPDNVARQIV